MKFSVITEFFLELKLTKDILKGVFHHWPYLQLLIHSDHKKQKNFFKFPTDSELSYCLHWADLSPLHLLCHTVIPQLA